MSTLHDRLEAFGLADRYEVAAPDRSLLRCRRCGEEVRAGVLDLHEQEHNAEEGSTA